MSASAAAPWAPPTADELTWFRASGRLDCAPRPLDFSFEIDALAFGISRALESLYFPFYELHARLLEGRLYFASVPSAFAERDLEAQMQRMRDSGLRFTRNIRRTWERPIRGEVEEYTGRMTAFPAADAANADVASALRALKRTRANQWFAASRAVFAPAELLKQGVGETAEAEAQAVVREALSLVAEKGAAARDGALHRVGERLAVSGAIDNADDVHWLDFSAVRAALPEGARLQMVVAAARADHGRVQPTGPDTVGPALPNDAPCMFLIREILALVA